MRVSSHSRFFPGRPMAMVNEKSSAPGLGSSTETEALAAGFSAVS